MTSFVSSKIAGNKKAKFENFLLTKPTKRKQTDEDMLNMFKRLDKGGL